ncbi:MAG TPA: hypothetical protein VFQ85_15910 [Mycobacteriales bacterium]|jgi:hypothetical protein|nr:hypothetical protein [Mycobacteriales bacterium]
MTGDRLGGPLTYSVEPPSGEASAERPIVIGGVAVAAMLALGLVGGWFALGYVAASRLIVDGVPVAIVAIGLGLAAWFARTHLRRARRTALLVVGIVAVVAAILANHVLGTIKPALPQVRHAVDQIDLPGGFHKTDETSHGDRFCRQGCPTLVRHYAAPETDPDPVRTLILAMFSQGWEQVTDVPRELATVARRGDIVVQLAEKQPHVVEVTASRTG